MRFATHRVRAAAIALAATIPAAPARAQRASWSIELFGGSAYSLPMPLRIRQGGQPAIRLTARYDTRPFTDSPYYAYRLGRWTGGSAWEVELVHHKLYLRNPPPEVQHLEVSHGYNLLTIDRAWRRGVTIRVGLGVVIAHPETVVRRESRVADRGIFASGYYLAGPTAQLAVAKRFPVWEGLFAAAEGKVTGSYARFPVARGHATAPNVALHALVGLGYAF